MLDQGVIVERGTHHQLLAQGGALRQHVEPPARGGSGAREARALVDDEAGRPNRNPPVVEPKPGAAQPPADGDVALAPPIEPADAAE